MKLHGILPAILTPLNAEGRVNLASYSKLVERLYAKGVHGIYVAGQTGEGLLLPMDERMQLAEVSRAESASDKQVIVHIGAHRIAEAVELAKHAQRIGVSAVSSLPPVGSYSFAEIKEYYQALASASDLPFLVYFFPAFAPVITSVDQILELCEIPNVVGLKFTDMNLYRLERIKANGKVIYNGHDEVLAAGLLMGADGGIGTFYNLVPEMFLEIYSSIQAGDNARAMNVQQRVNELIELTLRFPAMGAVKRMMTWAGVDCGEPVGPRQGLTSEMEHGLIEALAASSFAEADFARPLVQMAKR